MVVVVVVVIVGMMRVLHGCFACCSAQVTISLKSGSPPAVSISTSSPSKVNTNDRVVLIGSARSSNPNPLNTSWSMVGTSTAFSLQVFGTTIASNAAVLVRPDDGCLTIYVCIGCASRALRLCITRSHIVHYGCVSRVRRQRKNVLVPGASYTFRFTAVDSDGVSGYAELALLINAPPTSGYVTASPLSGTALSTSFSFSAQQWTDDVEDLPLTYVFAYVVGNLTTLDDSSIAMVRCEQGLFRRDFHWYFTATMKVLAAVCDRKLNCRERHHRVRRLPAPSCHRATRSRTRSRWWFTCTTFAVQ